MKNFAKKIYRFLVLIHRLNIIKTIYFNFKVLSFRHAIKLPVFLYGKVYLLNLTGNLIIPENINTGMIKIGYRWLDLWPSSFLPTQIQVIGTLEFNGPAIISGGVNLNVQNNRASLIIGNKVNIGGGTVCKCLQNISIGSGSSITGNCVIMDCNMHFVKNIETGEVTNYKAPIFIGENCWINSGTTISKGTIIPNYSISARNSYLSKDYSVFGTNLFLVGSPAKPLPARVQRIFTIEKQNQFCEYFEKNDSQILQLQPGIEVENGHKEGYLY